MDLSKLPRMSQTPPPPPPPAPPPLSSEQRDASTDPQQQHPAPAGSVPYRQQVSYGTEPATGGLAEAWISIAIGVILLFATSALRLVQYLLAAGSFTWTFTDEQGAPIPYTRTVFIWGDAAMLLFAVVLILEGLLLFTRKRALIAGAFVITLVAVAVNLFFLLWMMGKGYGFQLPSALAVAFGIYIALFQWKLLQALRGG